MMYVYIQSEKDPPLYTVGFYDPSGKFQPESDHTSIADATDRVRSLNGGMPLRPSGDFIIVGTREEAAIKAIDLVEKLGKEYGEARAAERDMEDARPAAKRDATFRIMRGGNNLLTDKPHSASSAEAIVETDPDYLTFRKVQSGLVVAMETARGRFEAAILRAKLAVVMAGGS